MGRVPVTLPDWAQRAARKSSKPPAVIEHPAWFSGYWLKLLRKKQEAAYFKRQGWRYQLFRNDPIEDRRCRRLRIPGVLASHNAFVDEAIYRPIALPRIYDAVYVAKAEAFKRHELASGIRRLHFLMPSPVELQKIHPGLRHATVNPRNLSKEEIVRTLNQAVCTLALSREEGGMYACMESLLCGVPVVSTKSRGGRALFLNPVNSITVERDTAEAVSEAVKELARNPLNPTAIRARALGDLEAHRERMASHLSWMATNSRGMTSEFYRRLFKKSENVERIGDEIFVPDSAREVPTSVVTWLHCAP